MYAIIDSDQCPNQLRQCKLLTSKHHTKKVTQFKLLLRVSHKHNHQVYVCVCGCVCINPNIHTQWDAETFSGCFTSPWFEQITKYMFVNALFWSFLNWLRVSNLMATCCIYWRLMESTTIDWFLFLSTTKVFALKFHCQLNLDWVMQSIFLSFSKPFSFFLYFSTLVLSLSFLPAFHLLSFGSSAISPLSVFISHSCKSHFVIDSKQHLRIKNQTEKRQHEKN